MTTPQNMLYNIHYELKQLVKLLKGDDQSDEDTIRFDIYEMCKSIEIKTSEFSDRFALLEDKMNLIIRLLGKCNHG